MTVTDTETVTLLFTDLVGSTGLASRIGPSAAEELRREHFAILREAIGESGGTEVKNLGDGLMVVFASASKAIGCGVSMQQRFERRNRRAEEQLSVRVGISLGEADRGEDDYFGPPVIEAARLCAKAAGGQILVGELARMMAGGRGEHAFESVGALDLKGLPEPFPAFEVVWEPVGSEAALALPARLREVPPVGYVGRGVEREGLAYLWREASAGSRRMALIAGEPGIGKTRLATHLALQAHGEGATVLYGRCDDDLGVAYQPWVEALRHYVEAGPDAVLERHVERSGGELARLAPALRRRVDGLPDPQASDPDTERYLLFGAVANLLEEASREEPLVLILDDLHWADKPTLSLLRHVIDAGSAMSVLVLGTYRDSDLSRDHPLTAVLADLRRREGVTRVSLSGLTVDDVVALMEAAAGHEMDEAGAALAQEVAHETDGNPFFVAELLRHLVETGALAQGDDGRWRLRGSLGELGLPESVREVIGRRVNELGDATRRVLSAAAVIGRDFDVELLARVLETGEDELLDILEQAVEASVLAESAETAGRFTFAHALINHTLYDDLGTTRRSRLHHRVAEALEDLCGGDPGPRLPELAHHWSLATQPVDGTKALEYSRRAGELALAELAPDEALRWFGRALELLGEDGADDELRCDILTGIGEAQRQIGDQDFRQTLLEACAIADRLADRDRIARAALANSRGYASMFGFVDDERVAVLRRALELDSGGEAAQRARLMALLALELSFDPDHEGRRKLAEDALALAREAGDERTLATVLRDHFGAMWAGDTVARRVETTSELVRLADELGDPDLRGKAALFAFNTALERGDTRAAREHLDRCNAIAESVGQPELRWFHTYHASCLAMMEGRIEEASELTERAAEIGSEGGQPDILMIYGAQVACIAAEAGREDEVVELIEQSMEDNPGLPTFVSGLASVYARLGREEEARALLASGRAAGLDRIPRDVTWMTTLGYYARVAAELGDREAAAELYPVLLDAEQRVCVNAAVGAHTVPNCLGLLAVTMEDHERADEHFAEAVELEEREGLAASLVLSRIWWARSLLARGGEERAARARALLESAAELCRERGFARYLSWAEALLADPAGSRKAWSLASQEPE